MDRRRAVWQAYRVRIIWLTVAAAIALAGCSTQTTPTAPTPTLSSAGVAAGDAGAVTETVAVDLRSEASDLHTVGPDDRRVFGWNLLTGPATLFGEPVEVRLQGSVEYTDGNGPFDGFLRIVAPDGSQLAFYMDGQATAGTPTLLPARLEFIGASGRYAAMVAAGQFQGTREAAVGAPVVATIELTIDTDGVLGTVGSPGAPQPAATGSARASADVTPQ
jgi:hypothetical protein